MGVKAPKWACKNSHRQPKEEKVMDQALYIIGPLGITIAGWFIGTEIKRLRSQVDILLENQKDMAVQIARLEAKIK